MNPILSFHCKLFINFLLLLFASAFTHNNLFAQNVGIGTGTPNASAILDISAADKGLLVPRFNITNVSAAAPVATPATGLLVYNTNAAITGGSGKGFYYWNGTAWTKLQEGAASGGSGWLTTGNAGTVDGINYIGTTDNVPLNIRINNQNAGRIDSAGNIILGYLAGNSNTGFGNVAIGKNALYSNTTRSNLVAIGDSALYNNGIGASGILAAAGNTAIGSKALYSNRTGNLNTANGIKTLYSNTSGYHNTANGASALYSNTTGFGNIANGYNALYSNTTGYGNTVNGYQALYSNTTGRGNTANGYLALYFSTEGSDNTANGSNALYYNTTGIYNTATGSNALFTNADGNNNTANGYKALYSNTFGGENTANGASALYFNTSGAYNVANGSQALYSNTTGRGNTANGASALYLNTSGGNNTANGASALAVNTTGGDNTADGESALVSNTTGYRNTANGARSLHSNTTGYNNSANGYEALYSNTTGYNNSAHGESALHSNTTGRGNTTNGRYALYYNTTGNFNTGIGYNTFPSGFEALDNYTALGFGAGSAASASNMVEIGNTSVSVIRGQVGFTTYSDARIKDNVQDNIPGLSFIKLLRPVSYNLNIHRQNQIMFDIAKPDTTNWDGKYDIEKIRMTGFLAQEVDEAAKKVGYDFSGVVKPQNDKDLYSLRYSEFVVPMAKAIQEQQAMIEELKKQNELLQKRIEQLENK